MSEESFIETQEEHLSVHVFSVSAGMVGVCLMDRVFLCGLFLMVVVCLFVVYTFSFTGSP